MSSQAFYQLPVVASSAFNSVASPVSYLASILKYVFGSPAAQREETLDDRLAQVAQIRLSPSRFVAYQGDALKFDAVGLNAQGQVIQGVVFTWESASPEKIHIDDTGKATFNESGQSRIICRAGTAQASATVLVRPGNRPKQNDREWKNDQDALSDAESTGVGAILPALVDKLMPTAQAQGGGYAGTDFPFDEMWSEARNLTGNPRNRVLEPMALGSVLPEGSNFNFATPLIGLGGRGIGASLNLFYNSRVWSRHGNYVTFSPIGGNPFAGFSLGFGRIVTYGTGTSTKFVLVDPDGTLHYLGTGNGSVTTTYQTTDGTHITYVGKSINGALYYSDGTKVDFNTYNNRLLPKQITDANGNYIEIAYKYGVASPLAIDFVTDTKGRKIQFNYDASGQLISITAPGYGGTAQNPVTRTIAQFDYETRTLSYTFSGLTVENAPGGSVAVLKHIYFPGTNAGYLFTYSDYGMMHTLSMRRQMSIDANGAISDGNENATVNFNYPTVGSTSLTDAPAFTQRTESAPNTSTGVYTYSSSTDAIAQTMTFTIARPDSSNLILTRSTNSSIPANGLLTQTEITKNSISYSKTVTAYTTDGGSNVQPQTITTYDDTNSATKVDFDYDQYGNVTNKREYGSPISGNWQVRRRTRLTYKTDQVYLDAYLRSLVTLTEVFDALENTNDADDVLIAKTSFTYDDYAATGGMQDRAPKPPGHDSAKYTTSYTLRGNVTGITQWTDIANNTTLPTRLRKYDRMGNVIQEQVTCCKQKVFTFASNDYWANPPTVTQGDPQGLHLDSNTTYDFNTDLPKYTEYANMGKRWFYYDAALRLIRKELPGGTQETATYDDVNLTVATARTGQGTTTVSFDGWGRTKQQVDPNNGQVNTTYDALSRVASVTNPFTAGGSPGGATAYQYDALGRVTVATLPDSQTVQTAYSGAAMTLTDQVGRQIKREIDGLGRLAKVTEQDVSSGALNQETTYSYNLLNKLTGVSQGSQTRAWKYDALGRMLYEKIPEQTATINDGTGTLWTMKYTYTDFHAVQTRADARGVITTYSYDNLNRLTSVSYNTSGASGVAATSGVHYTFDNTNGSATNGLLLSVSKTAAWDAYQESYGYDTYKRLSSLTRTIDSASYATSYQYGAGDVRSRITYPSTRVVNINRDSVGRLTSLTDAASANYLSGVGYNVAGQVTGLTLGNGVVEAYGYDANRLQLTSQTATKGATSLMSLTYDYSASAGQSGAGSTAGNSGQLMSISGTIDATAESAAYTYDNLGRLVTSNQTTNTVTAQRRFVYDRWGNRTSVYDATSGGTQIQSLTLQQSGGAPTNRLTSVTTSGVTKNYSYDANGNVTSDGAHSYTYDAENRLASVDSGATASYAYDANNRRIKKAIGASVTHAVWEGGQVIAEYDAATSGLLSENIYSGSRLIARFSSSVTRYYVSDRLSARLTLDASGAVVGRQAHLPFGEELDACFKK
ncbi:MAG: hypothetical protein AB1757_26085 [Acidobacteriota bacterium]